MTLKIAVYAISKNEEQFVQRFCESAKDADLILIADTGSTDNTQALAINCGAVVHEICVSPWRFDKARDTALALIPRDFDEPAPVQKLNVYGKRIRRAYAINLTGVVVSHSCTRKSTTDTVITGITLCMNTHVLTGVLQKFMRRQICCLLSICLTIRSLAVNICRCLN